ncbi:1-(5-phosphoribosyl)-5-[(5-phosphoribosylamino)methylideneamino]imidazole-4-carboxamide isomerase [Lentibacillus amyloliquefaciens]|uniref:1-(5-phosphoribosyl)-5-[(5-phosphoribosylamino)methylideneamino] imidazole-4-carboxamide isomerase n=1 Tax=Lentibacillus amyloliquefaciens TaxID=1472767 RepID=A0A0U4E8P8_9BACI|nr:1-(5-phosphoribosyl)-5-[(5-phosphoribosylamino)methylideneamino]imidazole-4-carboxamide isomerase [Lentibacillus amyloliquefaciens]ALX49201.1 1-(5-phosphoribosyl)-5-((5-phosphoribosylamino)methylideneamino)imidazole-4-carboxamide isomerase [Lentibacillus amyloliquefaciens]
MILFPAIDIRNGKCVRLIQGDYNQEKIYNDSPADAAQQWEQHGAEFLHIVDLDGAKGSATANIETIRKIALATTIPVQVGGGIRSMEKIRTYLSAGVDRVIIGTAAINDQAFLEQAVNNYGDKIAVSIDARNGYVAIDGWTETSDIKATDLVSKLETIDVSTIIYTDILKDGMLKGPNFHELETINKLTSINVIASGGVSSKADVSRLKAMNLYGAIIGKALYDGTLSFQTLREET